MPAPLLAMVGYNVAVETVEERRKIACRAATAGKWAISAAAKMVGAWGRPWGRRWTKRRKNRAHATCTLYGRARVRGHDLAYFFPQWKSDGLFKFLKKKPHPKEVVTAAKIGNKSTCNAGLNYNKQCVASCPGLYGGLWVRPFTRAIRAVSW
jgi:hypothetical protein